MVKCPQCKSIQVTKYRTYAEPWHQLKNPDGYSYWNLRIGVDEMEETPENDYYKCEDCGLTWRTRNEKHS